MSLSVLQEIADWKLEGKSEDNRRYFFHVSEVESIENGSRSYVIGRKGTGKSTIFQRLQYELRHLEGYASAYIDIKTTYEESTTDPAIFEQMGRGSAYTDDWIWRPVVLSEFMAKHFYTPRSAQLTQIILRHVEEVRCQRKSNVC